MEQPCTTDFSKISTENSKRASKVGPEAFTDSEYSEYTESHVNGNIPLAAVRKCLLWKIVLR